MCRKGGREIRLGKLGGSGHHPGLMAGLRWRDRDEGTDVEDISEGVGGLVMT